MNTLLLFKDVRVDHAKVSHGPFVGLPSITGVHGLGGALCLELCKQLQLQPGALRLDGSLFAYDQYQLHEGFKKAYKAGTSTSEAVVAAWASFNAHLLFRIEARSAEAVSAMAIPSFRRLAAEVLSGLRLCKGSLRPQRQAVNLESPALQHIHTDVGRALAMMPPRARVVRDRSGLIEAARAAELPLMELLLAVTLRPHEQPARFRAFLASVEEYAAPRVPRFVPVTHGYLFLETQPSGRAQRLDVLGHFLPSWAASAAYTLAELQTVSSVRARLATQDDPDDLLLWKEFLLPQGAFLHAAV